MDKQTEERINELKGAHDLLNEFLKTEGVVDYADVCAERIKQAHNDELEAVSDVLILQAYRDVLCHLFGHKTPEHDDFAQNMAILSREFLAMKGINVGKQTNLPN